MNKNTTFPKLIQTFLSEVKVQGVLQEFGYKDPVRKRTVSSLLAYLASAYGMSGKVCAIVQM